MTPETGPLDIKTKSTIRSLNHRDPATGNYDVTTNIIAYENGELDEEATLALFQELVNSGLAWTLQGHYGRQAKALLDAGLIEMPS